MVLVVADIGEEFLKGFFDRLKTPTRLKFLCPMTTGVDDIPCWNPSLVSTFPRIVISESVDQPIPDGREHLDEKVFSKRNPDVIDGQVAAEKI